MNTKLRFYLRGLGIGLVVTTLILMVVRLNTHGGEMTDAQIRERAAELGMVDGNSYSLTDAVSQGKDDESRLNTDVLDKYNTEKPSETERYGNGEVLLSEEGKEADTENADADNTDTANSDAENADADNTDTASSDAENADAVNTDTENTDTENVDTENAGTDAQETDTPDSKDESGEATDDQKPPVTEETDNKAEDKPADNPQESVGSGTITIASGSASETAAAVLEKAGIITDAKDFNLYMCRNGYDRRIHPGTYTIDSGLTYEEICKIIAG